jgi:hypothetical protein
MHSPLFWYWKYSGNMNFAGVMLQNIGDSGILLYLCLFNAFGLPDTKNKPSILIPLLNPGCL